MASFNIYVADGVTTSFAVTFNTTVSSEIVVYAGDEELLTGYTYNPVTKAVVFSSPPTAGTYITIRRVTSTDLRYKFGQDAAFTGQNIDYDFEQLLYSAEESVNWSDYLYGRSLRVPSSEPGVNTLPSIADRRGKLLSFDSSYGQPIAVAPADGSAAAVAIDLAKTNVNVYEVQKRLAAEINVDLLFTFDTGGIVSDKNDGVLDRNTGITYIWAGALPKTVPANSTPASTGGISSTAWVSTAGKNLRTLRQVFVVEDYGAVAGDNAALGHANSKAIQTALTAAKDAGGGIVRFGHPGAIYHIDFPLWLVGYGVELDGCNITLVRTDPTFTQGRGNIVIGSSYEVNYDVGKAAYDAGTYPTATMNTSFVNPAQKQYLRDNPSFVQADHCKVHDIHCVAKFTSGTGWGGYAVNFVNAQHSACWNVTGSGWTQLIGMGSDTPPETPSCYNCKAFDLTVITGDLYRTYYSIGFMSNSTDCTISRGRQIKPLTAGTQNGSAIATNLCENCLIEDIDVPNLGLTVSSEGVLINNSKGCITRNIRVGGCISAVSHYYTDASFNDAASPNVFENITSNGTYVFSTRAKYAEVRGVAGYGNYQYDLYFGNSNSTNNVLDYDAKSIAFGGSTLQTTYLSNNTVKNWRRSYIYLRPAPLLQQDKVDVLSWSTNNNVHSKVDVNMQFMYALPPDIKAIDDVRMFLTFNIGAGTKGSNCALSLRRQVAYDGNTSTAPYIEFSNSVTATLDTTFDTTLVAQMGSTAPGYVLSSDTTHGLENSLDVLISFTNNVNNNICKHMRLAVWRAR